MVQHRNLSFGVGVGGINTAAAILTGNGSQANFDLIGNAHFMQGHDNGGRTGIGRMIQGQH